MSIIKKTFEVDKFLTRELLLRNPDNSYPSANQAVLTDGNGGTYLAPLNPTIPTTGFNQITLTDSQAIFSANMPFNNLNIKQGKGVLISKQTISNQDYLTFQVTALIPSSFFGISTPTGIVYADGQSSILKVVAYNGVEVTASTNNSLYIGGTPSFGIINLSSIDGYYSLVPSTSISSVTIQEGFGIQLTQTSISSFSITNRYSTLALNSIILPQSTLVFKSVFNQIIFSTAGTTQINIGNNPNSTIISFANYAFSNVQIPSNTGIQRLEASTLNNNLIFAPAYGITYSSVNSQLQLGTSLPSSFTYISTPRGTIDAKFSTNILTLNNGYGIDYDINPQDQALTIKLASTFVSQISTETGVITVNNDSILNLRQGRGIIYSTSTDKSLFINSKDFDRIDILDGITGVITTSLFSRLNYKTFQFIQGPGINIFANTNSNRITIQQSGVVPVVDGPRYAFSYFNIYSTASFLGQNINSFVDTNTITAIPIVEASMGVVPVFPIKMQADSNNKNFYIGLDQSTLLFSTTTQLSSINSIFSQYNMDPEALSLTVSTLSSLSIDSKIINVSSLYVGNSIIATTTPTISSLLIASKISSIFTETQMLYPSTIGNNITSTPLMVFDYISSQVGVNLGLTRPQATLHVNGTILASNYATYSDSSLKNFNKPYQIEQADLDMLKPWNFTWKDTGLDDVGFAAEDVEKVLPSAVRRGENGLRMVDYGRLSIVSLAALRDTNRRLLSIESTLQALTSTVNYH
jgi:hypothetical protein